MLFLTHTTISVPSLTGAIMCMGVATANSILVVSFAKEQLAAGGRAADAAVEAGFTRFRPVLMTALAMIIGMVPMALGLRRGRRTERAARPRGDRRADARDGRDAVLRAGGVRAASPQGRGRSGRSDSRAAFRRDLCVKGPILGAVALLAAVGAVLWGVSTRTRALGVVTQETRSRRCRLSRL